MHILVCVKSFFFPWCQKHNPDSQALNDLTTPISSHTILFFAYLCPSHSGVLSILKPVTLSLTFWASTQKYVFPFFPRLLLLITNSQLIQFHLSHVNLLHIYISQLVIHLLFISFLPYIIISCYFTYLLVFNHSPK